MMLTHATFEVLNQLAALLEQLDEEEYSLTLPVISNNSIGKHVRHILEFYICLLQGQDGGVIDYDLRKRDVRLETEISYALHNINNINALIIQIAENKKLTLIVGFSETDENAAIETTLYREMAYNIEHVIHHFALIKIAVETALAEVKIPENFGVAFSTIKHQHKTCAQ